MLSNFGDVGNSVFRSTKKIKNVAIIGAGAAGLITLYHLKKRNIKATIYERSDHVGGIWRIDYQSPLYDKLVTNLPKEIMAFSAEFPFDNNLSSFVTHGDMYAYLHDFSVQNNLMEDIQFNSEIISVEKQPTAGVSPNLAANIDSNGWMVQYTEAATDGDVPTLRRCDYSAVVVCNGHFNLPISPIIPGVEHFKGTIMHSAHYRNAEELLEREDSEGPVSGTDIGAGSSAEAGDGVGVGDGEPKYRGKRILIIGAKSSATDITRELAAVASSMHVSDRHCTIGCSYDSSDGTVFDDSTASATVVEDEYVRSSRTDTQSGVDSADNSVIHLHPGVARVNPTGAVVFTDGSSVHVDVIMCCTGYEYDFPFLRGASSRYEDSSDRSLTVTVSNRSVRKLYQHMYLLHDPTLVFVGLNHSIVPFPMFYYQAMHLAAAFDFWTCVAEDRGNSGSRGGDLLLPPLAKRAEALRLEEEELSSSDNPRNYHNMGEKQWAYMRMLVSQVHRAALLSEDLDLDRSDPCATAAFASDSEVHIRMMRAVYDAVSCSRPWRVGMPDTYRRSQYSVDSFNSTCTVTGANGESSTFHL